MSYLIFTTGGTLDKVYFDAKGGFEVGATVVHDILERARLTQDVPVVELLRKDSLDISAEDRRLIKEAVRNCPVDRVIITHGTDTMTDTAQELAQLAGKTVVLTGALQPGRFLDSDGPFNLGMAVATVQVAPAGVYIVANGQVFEAARVRKNREANRFEPIVP